jgi:hypothetical protein
MFCSVSDAGPLRSDICWWQLRIPRIVRLQPDGHTPPEVLDSLKIDEWLPHGERDGLRGEYHGL